MGETVGYNTDLGTSADVSPITKRRVYDEARDFLCNYKTVIGKEDALQRANCDDIKEGLLSGPFAESGIMAKYPKAL